MPQTQLSSRLGTDNSIFGLDEQKKVPSSDFDFSKLNYTTTDIGCITPVDWFDVFPGDKISLDIRYLLNTFPLAVPTMTNYHVRTHWYFVRKSALWKGWETFITRGRSGNIDTTIPSISSSDIATAVGSSYYDCPNSLMNHLGLPPLHYSNSATDMVYKGYIPTTNAQSTGKHIPSAVSALPFMAYQKICRCNYMPTNLLQDNKVWFPDNLQDEWMIESGKGNLNGIYFVPHSIGTVPESPVTNDVPSADADTKDTAVNLLAMRYALYGNDYFTSAKPWIVRGTEASLDNVPIDLSNVSADGSISIPGLNVGAVMAQYGFQQYTGNRSSSSVTLSQSGPFPGSSYSSGVVTESASTSVSIPLNGVAGLAITANTLRSLLALSVWQERNTLTDGNYNRTIQVHWNRSPKSPEYDPIYIGGTSDIISFGEVIQTSADESGKPLGTRAGLGSANAGGSVFNFDVNDYGIIMGVMIISPEVIYKEGVGHEWTDLDFDSQFQPEFANLGYQPILNQEIYCSGNDEVDKDLFGYQTRYAYLKQRRNSVSGMFSLTYTQDTSFGAFVQGRNFASLPALSNQFVTMSPDNIDRNFLAFKYLPAFQVQFASDVRLRRNLPYQCAPNTFGF